MNQCIVFTAGFLSFSGFDSSWLGPNNDCRCNKGGLLTLLIHLTALAVRRVRVVPGRVHLSIALIDHSPSRGSILARHLTVGRLIANRRQLGTDIASIGGRLRSLRRIRSAGSIHLAGLSSLSSGGALALFSSLARVLLLLLPCLPLLADLLELCRNEMVRTASGENRKETIEIINHAGRRHGLGNVGKAKITYTGESRYRDPPALKLCNLTSAGAVR